MTAVIRTLVVEDSPVQRDLLVFLLEEADGFQVVGCAADGIEAIDSAERLRPDLVLMDCHMPRLDGLGATRIIMERCPTPIVMVSASLLPEDVSMTFDAVKAGALAVLAKPTMSGDPRHESLADDLIRTLRLMAEVKVVRRWPAMSGKPGPAGVPAAVGDADLRCIALAGSTGAPGPMADILTAIGPGLSVPVVIVQHLAAGFVDGYAQWLGQRSGLPVTVAADRSVLEPGRVYVAPDRSHLAVERGRTRLDRTAPPESGFRPSASFLFRSMARAYGRHGAAVLLSGMGRDGADGMRAVRDAGGMTLTQDEATSVIFGMPGEAVRLGAVEQSLPPVGIARRLRLATGREN